MVRLSGATDDGRNGGVTVTIATLKRSLRCWVASVICCWVVGGWAAAADHSPISLHPDNPHYLLWRGKPTVLIGSTEHYGAVLNLDFDYRKYLAALQRDGMNLTRAFSGVYCERPGDFKISSNTLAPAEGRLIAPWARSDQPGYAGGGNKFDLERFDPAYFERLRDFVAEAGRRGVVVEVVLFCPFYEEHQWTRSPMHVSNNVNGVGKVGRKQAYELAEERLTAAQESVTRKIVAQLNEFDNVFFEIANEPYFGVSPRFEARIAQVIAETERSLPNKHLIAQNIANGAKKIENPLPQVSIFNFHYATPPDAVAMNYGLNKVIGDDETGFKGTGDEPYRIEAWAFLVAGGATFDHLDYSFAVGHEGGDLKQDAPGGGGAALRRSFAALRRFIEGFEFVKMKPMHEVVRTARTDKFRAYCLAEAGRAYAVYAHGERRDAIALDLPAGRYEAKWIDPRTGEELGGESIDHGGGERAINTPRYEVDIALRVVRR